MARRATIDDILANGETDRPIPGLLDAQGQPMTIRVRKVHAGERNLLLPQLPAHLFEKLPEEPEERTKVLQDRQQRWVDAMSPEEVAARRRESADYCVRLVALAAVDPVLTEEEVRRLGDAAVLLAAEIEMFSQNKLPAPGVPETEAPDPAAG